MVLWAVMEHGTGGSNSRLLLKQCSVVHNRNTGIFAQNKCELCCHVFV